MGVGWAAARWALRGVAMGGWFRWVEFFSSAGALLCATALAAPPADKPADQAAEAKEFDKQFRPLLAKHCVGCHRGEKPKGNLRLDNLTTNLGDGVARQHWAAVVKRLQAGEMPPEEK